MNWGNAIIEIRKIAGLKQAELARKIGISKTAMYQIEAGKAKPSDDTLQKIAEHCKSDVGTITMLAIDFETDMEEEARNKFLSLFPDFQQRILASYKMKVEEDAKAGR